MAGYQSRRRPQRENFGSRAGVNPDVGFIAAAWNSTRSLSERKLLVGMLSKDHSGRQLWTCTARLQVIVGPVRPRRQMGVDSRGRKLGPCEWACRLTVQRLIDNLERDGVLKKIIPENSWVGQPGNLEFRHSATYEFHTEKLRRGKTEAEWVEERREARFRAQRASRAAYASHRPAAAEASSPESSPIPPDAPTASSRPAQPAAARSQPPPAAAVREQNPTLVDLVLDGSRRAERMRKLRVQFASRVAELIAGCERYLGREGWVELQPNHPDFQLPLPRDQAFQQARKDMGLTEAEAAELREFVKEQGEEGL